jgi:hypothetical protein
MLMVCRVEAGAGSGGASSPELDEESDWSAMVAKQKRKQSARWREERSGRLGSKGT